MSIRTLKLIMKRSESGEEEDQKIELKKYYNNKTYYFSGTMSTISTKHSGKYVLLLRDVYVDTNYVADHVWITIKDKQYKTLKPHKYGTKLKIQGKVIEYNTSGIKKYGIVNPVIYIPSISSSYW